MMRGVIIWIVLWCLRANSQAVEPVEVEGNPELCEEGRGIPGVRISESLAGPEVFYRITEECNCFEGELPFGCAIDVTITTSDEAIPFVSFQGSIECPNIVNVIVQSGDLGNEYNYDVFGGVEFDENLVPPGDRTELSNIDFCFFAGEENQPTESPTTPAQEPTESPAIAETLEPTSDPFFVFTENPTEGPVMQPTESPEVAETQEPTSDPLVVFTETPTEGPVVAETQEPTSDPIIVFTETPTEGPVMEPTESPVVVETQEPTEGPVMEPTESPEVTETQEPTSDPFVVFTDTPTEGPVVAETQEPTSDPFVVFTETPTVGPVMQPTESPEVDGTQEPTSDPFVVFTETPTEGPSTGPTESPAVSFTDGPTADPTIAVTGTPSLAPTEIEPTEAPLTQAPTLGPATQEPSANPTVFFSASPTEASRAPTSTHAPSRSPTEPTRSPRTNSPTRQPSTSSPATDAPSASPQTRSPTTLEPTENPTACPSTASPLTRTPTTRSPRTKHPVTRSPSTTHPTTCPTECPTRNPTIAPTTETPTTYSPTTNAPTTSSPSFSPATHVPTMPNDTFGPTRNPATYAPHTWGPTKAPHTKAPTKKPTPYPIFVPTKFPTKKPTRFPSPRPTKSPTRYPTRYPTKSPTRRPTRYPTYHPTKFPTRFPTRRPTSYPTHYPIPNTPTPRPTEWPSPFPTLYPTRFPTMKPTAYPSYSPTQYPTKEPTKQPTRLPTFYPTLTPRPSASPTLTPTRYPTREDFDTCPEGYQYLEGGLPEDDFPDEPFKAYEDFEAYPLNIYECANACDLQLGCLAFSWDEVEGQCYRRSHKEPDQTHFGVPPVTFCAQLPRCPRGFDSELANFQSTDLADTNPLPNFNPLRCSEICTEEPWCGSFEFEYPTETCYLFVESIPDGPYDEDRLFCRKIPYFYEFECPTLGDERYQRRLSQRTQLPIRFRDPTSSKHLPVIEACGALASTQCAEGFWYSFSRATCYTNANTSVHHASRAYSDYVYCERDPITLAPSTRIPTSSPTSAPTTQICPWVGLATYDYQAPGRSANETLGETQPFEEDATKSQSIEVCATTCTYPEIEHQTTCGGFYYSVSSEKCLISPDVIPEPILDYKDFIFCERRGFTTKPTKSPATLTPTVTRTPSASPVPFVCPVFENARFERKFSIIVGPSEPRPEPYSVQVTFDTSEECGSFCAAQHGEGSSTGNVCVSFEFNQNKRSCVANLRGPGLSDATPGLEDHEFCARVFDTHSPTTSSPTRNPVPTQTGTPTSFPTVSPTPLECATLGGIEYTRAAPNVTVAEWPYPVPANGVVKQIEFCESSCNANFLGTCYGFAYNGASEDCMLFYRQKQLRAIYGGDNIGYMYCIKKTL